MDKKRGKTVTKEAGEIRQRLALDQHRREQDPIEQNRLRLTKLREAGFLTPTRTKLSSEHLCVKKGPAPLPWVSSCGGAGQSPARVHLRHAGFLSGHPIRSTTTGRTGGSFVTDLASPRDELCLKIDRVPAGGVTRRSKPRASGFRGSGVLIGYSTFYGNNFEPAMIEFCDRRHRPCRGLCHAETQFSGAECIF